MLKNRKSVFVSNENSTQIKMSEFGGKAGNLHKLGLAGENVPPWYAVSSAVFIKSAEISGMAEKIGDLISRLDKNTGLEKINEASLKIKKLVGEIAIPKEQLSEILTAHRAMIGVGAFFSVRSSAPDEDGVTASFAGLHDSFLFLKGEDELADAIRKVWASAFNPRALVFRLQNGFATSSISMAVVVQKMVEADVSGIMFTANPNTGNPLQILISSLYGAGEGIVSAGLDADLFIFDKYDASFSSEIADKAEQLVHDLNTGKGLRKIPVPDDRRKSPSIGATQIRTLAETGLRIEKLCGHPQDIEFSMDSDGVVFILQSRSISTAKEYGPAAGNRLIWDNSNIVESYSGPTSPMTFSFIRRAYTVVYHCFSEVMGIDPEKVRRNRPVFENMLGIFRGQVYYNIVNWYRLVALFPGFQYNRKFMESMMGLKEKIEIDEDEARFRKTSFRNKYFVELPALARLLIRSAWNFIRIEKLAGDFHKHFTAHYEKWDAMDFDSLPPHSLMAIYVEMEEALLWNWKTPIINDFFVMIFYGTLKKKCVEWCGDTSGSLQNDLICGEGGIESAEPAKLLMKISTIIRKDKNLTDIFMREKPEDLLRIVRENPACATLSALLDRYLHLYGFRCMNELKLEEPSLRDDPSFIFQMIQNYLKLKDEKLFDHDLIERKEKQIRREAEKKAFGAIGQFHKKIIFRKLLGNARLGVKNRENMRFARTRIYGLLRKLINAIGLHFEKEGILTERHDIYYLTIDEVWDYIKGTAVTCDLKGLAELRKKEYATYRDTASQAPDDHFETYGIAYHRNLFVNWTKKVEKHSNGALCGIGCCPGTVRNKIKILKSPKDDMALDGEILVAGRTDPGWVPLYPAVSGILIERGSILSHSAIVAREMGIPTIVGIPNLLSSLEDGQVVEMDGKTGIVIIIPGQNLSEDNPPV